eukprot:SAG31_NODE_787_length_12094_cov_27.048270_3_plen_88_part_00
MEGHRFGCADPRLRRANATSGQMDLAEEGETTASTKSGTNFARPKRTGEIQVQISAAWLRGSFSVSVQFLTAALSKDICADLASFAC